MSPAALPVPRRRLRAGLRSTALVAILAGSAWAQAATFTTTTTVPASVPDGTCDPVEFTVPVSGLTGPITALSATLGLQATWAGDVVAELVAPGGVVEMPLFSRIGRTGGGGFGSSSDFSGDYTFVDPSVSSTNIWTAAATSPIPPGTYATTGAGSDAATALLTTFAGLTTAQINGDWTVRVSDCAGGDATSVSAVSLNIEGSADVTPSASVTPVPTLGEWSLMLLGALAAALGLRRLRRS